MNRLQMAIVLTAAVLLSGCIERELTITSEPPRTLVFISDVEKGRTPLKTEFTWYGNYDIILRREGYETLKTSADINAPIYALPPIDLFSAMAPWTYHDRRYLHFQMSTLEEVGEDELVRRADALAERNRQAVSR